MPRDVRGTWKAVHRNGTTLEVDVAGQDGDGTFHGTCRFKDKFGGLLINFPGELTDTRVTEDDQIVFRADIVSGNKLRYSGRFDFQGRLNGYMMDESDHTFQDNWVADKLFG